MNSVGDLSVSTLLQLLTIARPQKLTDGERVDMWAVRVAVWRATIPDVRVPVSSLPDYVDCGAFSLSSHRIADYFVQAYVIWIAPEPMPFSVYERLARRRITDAVADIEVMEEVELDDWVQTMHSRHAVASFQRDRESMAPNVYGATRSVELQRCRLVFHHHHAKPRCTHWMCRRCCSERENWSLLAFA